MLELRGAFGSGSGCRVRVAAMGDWCRSLAEQYVAYDVTAVSREADAAGGGVKSLDKVICLRK